MYRRKTMAAGCCLAAATRVLPAEAQDSAQPETAPPGQEKSGKMRALEIGGNCHGEGWRALNSHPSARLRPAWLRTAGLIIPSGCRTPFRRRIAPDRGPRRACFA
jgi:hypothetical protein